MLLFAAASAASPERVASWPVDARIVEILDGHVVTAGEFIEIWTPDGILTAQQEGPAAGLALTDLDDDGVRDLIACTRNGLLAFR